MSFDHVEMNFQKIMMASFPGVSIYEKQGTWHFGARWY
jgi:hypothetical protein